MSTATLEESKVETKGATNLCSFSECGRPRKGRGLCRAHLDQQNRGRPLVPLFSNQRPKGSPPRIECVEAHHPNLDTPCHVWQKATNAGGYGIVKLRGHVVLVHRYSFELANGPIADGLFVLHRCDNRRCVNPDHLFLGTNDDNIADMVCKDRQNRKLSDVDVMEIRRLRSCGSELATIAELFGINPATVSEIARGKKYKRLPLA